MPKDLDASGKAAVSVVTRTLGNLPFLTRCLSGLRAASSRVPVEWILVDDGSENPPSLRRFVDDASRSGMNARMVYSNSHHRAKAANAGLAAVSCDHVHFLDDDDVVLPGFYETTMDMLARDRRLGAAAVKCERVVETGELDGKSFRELSRTPHYPEVAAVTLVSLAVTQTVPLISVLFRREFLERAGGFDPALEVCEDYDLLLRFLCLADIGLSSERLIRFHQRQGAAGIAGNSAVTSDFLAENSYFRNAMLRRDLNDGRIGLGWLLALGELSAGSVKTDRILSQLHKNRLLHSAFGILRRQ